MMRRLSSLVLISGLWWSTALRPPPASSSEKLHLPPASDKECLLHPHWSTAECLRAREATVFFQQLIKASGLNPRGLNLRFNDASEVNAFFDHSSTTIVVNRGYLRRPQGALLSVISHELGHWVQYLEKLLPLRHRTPYSWKQIEAHADWLGTRLAARAGFGPDMWLHSRALGWGCDGLDAQFRTHPSNKDRLTNIKSKEHLLTKYVRREDLKVFPAPFRSGESPNIFQQDGAIGRKVELTLEQAQENCVEAEHLLGEGEALADLLAGRASNPLNSTNYFKSNRTLVPLLNCSAQ